MRSARLDQALTSGLIDLPAAGRILTLRPRIGDDLSALPQDRLLVVTGFRPDHDWFAARGHATASRLSAARALGPAAAAILCLPRAKAQARALLAEAATLVAPGGPIIVDGQKTDGIDAVLKDLRTRVPLSETLSKAHGKLAVFPAPADSPFADWAAAPLQVEGFTTRPGVFSAEAVDRGSALLAAALPADLKGRAADLGAGWGYLSRALLSRPAITECHLVEAEIDALDCAQINIPDPRAQFHWADATTWKMPRPLDHIVMNPPFHIGRDADPALGAAFITAAARLLSPQGVLWLVANRHLPYDRSLSALFRDVTEIGGDAAFRLTRAAYPVRNR